MFFEHPDGIRPGGHMTEAWQRGEDIDLDTLVGAVDHATTRQLTRSR